MPTPHKKIGQVQWYVLTCHAEVTEWRRSDGVNKEPISFNAPKILTPIQNKLTELTSTVVWVQFSWWLVISGSLSKGKRSSIIWENNSVEKIIDNLKSKELTQSQISYDSKIVIQRAYKYRIYPCIMCTFFLLKNLRKLWCVLYTESFVLDSRPSLACKQIHEMCPYTIICF